MGLFLVYAETGRGADVTSAGELLGYLSTHPLTVLFLTALVSGLLIPWITRRWNNHQKALEIKTGLVTDLSKSIMEMIMAIQYTRLGAPSHTQEAFDKAYRKWEVESAVIGTKLEAYFPQNDIPTEWTKFSNAITDFYAIEGVGPDRRDEAQSKLWQSLGKRSPLVEGDGAWLELKNEILHRKAELIKRVLSEKISVFS